MTLKIMKEYLKRYRAKSGLGFSDRNPGGHRSGHESFQRVYAGHDVPPPVDIDTFPRRRQVDQDKGAHHQHGFDVKNRQAGKE